MFEFVSELWMFIRERRKAVLLPLIVALAVADHSWFWPKVQRSAFHLHPVLSCRMTHSLNKEHAAGGRPQIRRALFGALKSVTARSCSIQAWSGTRRR